MTYHIHWPYPEGLPSSSPLPGESESGMIAQIWHGWTRSEDSQVYASLLQTRILAQLDNSKTSRGAYVLQRSAPAGEVEFLVVTLFDSALAVHNRNSAQAEPACSCNEEKHLLCRYDEDVTQFEIVTDPQRTLLYTKLRRRFPLRIMAPR